MRSVSSSLAFSLLLLVQILAPLLHAHTSGNTGNGALHIPGLESLYLTHDKAMQSSSAEQAEGLVVGIAQGLRQPFDTDIAFTSSQNVVLHDLPPIPSIALNGQQQTHAPHHDAVILDRIKPSPPTRGPPA